MLFLIECSCFFYKCILYENYFNILRMMFGYINYVLYLLYLWILISFYFYVFIELNDVLVIINDFEKLFVIVMLLYWIV